MEREFRHYYPRADLTKFDISDKYGVSFNYKGMGYDVFKNTPSGPQEKYLDLEVEQAMLIALGPRSSSSTRSGGDRINKKIVAVSQVVSQSNFPLKYLLGAPKYPIRDSEDKLNYNLKLKISATESEYFTADVRNVFSDVPIKHTTAEESHIWLRSPNMRYWPQQLNFAVWCATAGCGVGYDMMKEESIMAFHFHFTVRRILYELSATLPGDSGFDPKSNNYNKVAYQRLCKEFKIPENTDFRFPGYNNGLGYVYGYWGPHLMTDHEVHYMRIPWPFKGAKFKDEGGSLSDTTSTFITHIFNNKATNQYFNYLLPKGKGLTAPGLARINRSIEAFVYCILMAQADTRSSIVGISGSAQETRQRFLDNFESAIIENDIAKSIQRYQLAVQSAKARLDFAISPGCWLFPSNLVINTGSVPGYNNKLQRVTKDMKFGVNDVNQEIHKIIPHFVETSPTLRVSASSTRSVGDKDEESPKKHLESPKKQLKTPKKQYEFIPKEEHSDHTLQKIRLSTAAIALGYYIIR